MIKPKPKRDLDRLLSKCQDFSVELQSMAIEHSVCHCDHCAAFKRQLSDCHDHLMRVVKTIRATQDLLGDK